MWIAGHLAVVEGRRFERVVRSTPGVAGADVMRCANDLSAELGCDLPPGDYVGPGETAPVTGVYESYHLRGCHTLYSGRPLRAGERVPACPWCGEGVLYRVPPNPHRIN